MTYPPPPPPPYGAPYPYGPPPGEGFGPPLEPPNSYLVWSIVCTALCCLPLGIVAIINSSKVSGLWATGQYAEAQATSEKAKKFAIWGAILGALLSVVYLVISVALERSSYS